MAYTISEEEKKKMRDMAKAQISKIDKSKLINLKNTIKGTSGIGIKKVKQPTPEQQKYIKNLGYTPSELPSFFSERKDKNFLEATVGQLLDRFGSGFNKAFGSAYTTAARVASQKDPGALANVAMPGFQLAKNYLEGFLGNTDYSKNVSGIRELTDNPDYQKNINSELKRQKIGSNVFGINSTADFVNNPTIQYATQNVASIFDPVANLAMGGAAKGIKYLAKAGSKLPIAEKTINAVRASIDASPTMQKIGNKLVYGLGAKSNEIAGVDNIRNALKGNEIIAGAQNLLAKGKTFNPSELATLEANASRYLTKEQLPEFMALVNKAQAKARELSKGKGIVAGLKDTINPNAQEEIFKGLVKNNQVKGSIEEILAAPYKYLNEKGLTPKLIESKRLNQADAINNYIHYAYKDKDKLMKYISGADETVGELAKIPGSQSAKGGIKPDLSVFKDRLSDKGWAKLYAKYHPEVKPLLKDPSNLGDLAFKAREEAGLLTNFADASAISLKKSADVVAVDKGLADLHKTLIDNGRVFDTVDQIGKDANKFAQVPMSEAYGALAGKLVPSFIVQELKGTIEPSVSSLTKLTSIWKKGVMFAPGNTAPILRNQASAIIQHWLTGIPVYDQFRGLPSAFKDVDNGTQIFKEGIKNGLFDGTSDNIMGKVTRDALSKGGILDKANDIANVATKGNKLWGRTAFSRVEMANRLMGYKYWRGKGKSVDEAINLVNKAMYDYSKAPQLIKELGNSAVPFIQFKYFAAKQLLETLATKPEKLYQLYKGKNFIEGLSAQMANERDLPDWIKNNRATMIRTPFQDASGNVTYYDMANILPFGDAISGKNQVESLVLGNPFLKTAYDLSNNTNTYFDKPITDPKDLPDEQIQKKINYVLGQLTPKTLLNPFSYNTQKLAAAVTGKEDQGGRVNTIGNTLGSSLLGARLYNVNPTTQAKYNRKDVQSQISKLNTRIKDINSDKNLSAREKEDKIKEIRLYQQELKVNSGYYQ